MKHFRSSLLIFLLTVPLTACGLSGGPVEGQVLEEGTGKPIPGAIVLLRWEGTWSMLVDSQSDCYHAEAAITDAQGRYHVPKWHEWPKGPVFTPGPMSILTYKKGYERSNEFFKKEAYRKNNDILKRTAATREQRLEYLLNLSGEADCYTESSKQSLLMMQAELSREAKGLAVSAKDRIGILWIRRRAYYSWKKTDVSLTDEEIDSLIQRDKYLREQLK